MNPPTIKPIGACRAPEPINRINVPHVPKNITSIPIPTTALKAGENFFAFVVLTIDCAIIEIPMMAKAPRTVKNADDKFANKKYVVFIAFSPKKL